jgi:hypothetical protein
MLDFFLDYELLEKYDQAFFLVFFTKFKLADSEKYESFLNGKVVVLIICLSQKRSSPVQ